MFPMMYGTLVSSTIALSIAVPIGLACAIVLSENFLPQSIRTISVFLMELLAAIPSIVYGFWGIYVLIPFLRGIEVWLHQYFGWLPLFSTLPVGPGMLAAGVILAIMILPIITALSRDSLAAVPNDLRLAAYGVGSTRWQTIFSVIIPAAFSGIVGGIMLAFGRALGGDNGGDVGDWQQQRFEFFANCTGKYDRLPDRQSIFGVNRNSKISPVICWINFICSHLNRQYFR